MAKIPWWLWLGVGAVIFFISSQTGEKMQVFTYIGMLFIIVGIFKLIVAFIIGGKGRRAIKESRELRGQGLACPRCSAVVASTYEFCPHCGTRLRY